MGVQSITDNQAAFDSKVPSFPFESLQYNTLSMRLVTKLLLMSYQSETEEISPGFIGRTDAKAETPVLWPPHAKSGLIGKDSDAGRDWGQEEKGTTEDEMAGWHHRLDGRESE